MQIIKSLKARNLTFYILVLVILGNLIKLWHYKYFPSADGAAHVEIAAVTSQLLSGACPNISKVFAFTLAIVPTWIANIILAITMLIFPAYAAEKVLLSIYIILFPTIIYLIIHKINPRMSVLALAACLFMTNYSYYSGNYNFIFSFIFYLFSLNWFIVNRNSPNTPKKLFILFLLFCLNYLFHLFGYIAFSFSILIIYTTDLISSFTKQNLRKYVKQGLICLLCILPSLVAFIHYLTLPRLPFIGVNDLFLNLLHIIMPTVLWSGFDFNYKVIFAANIYFLIIIIFLAWKRFSNRKNEYDFFLFIAFSLTLLSLILPGGFAGGSMIGPRLQVYIYTMSILWLATFEISKNHARILTACFCGALLYQGYVSLGYFENYNHLAAHIDEAEKVIPDNSVVYSSNQTPDKVDFRSNTLPARISYYKIGSYLTADKICLINASSFALGEKNTFPVGFKDVYNPNYHLGRLRDNDGKMLQPPIADFEKYFADTGENIDFVLIIGDKPNLLKTDYSFRPYYQSADGILKIYKSIYYDQINRTDN